MKIMKDFTKKLNRINEALKGLEENANVYVRAKKNNLKLQDLENQIKIFKKYSLENEELISSAMGKINKLIKKENN